MSAKTVRVEKVGPAAVITIHRPERHNAISKQTAIEIGEAVSEASIDEDVRGILLTASGDRIFSSGGDLHEILAAVDSGSAHDVTDLFAQLATLETCDVPVIAAVTGDVLGGAAELILLCDFVIIEEHVHIAFRHARMGLSPAWGGLSRLLERVGPLQASRLLLTAEKVTAPDALAAGLVSEVVPKGFARERALARVSHIADNPRATVAAMKRTLHEVRSALRAPALGIERKAFTERWGTPEHLAAMRAFRERS